MRWDHFPQPYANFPHTYCAVIKQKYFYVNTIHTFSYFVYHFHFITKKLFLYNKDENNIRVVMGLGSSRLCACAENLLLGVVQLDSDRRWKSGREKGDKRSRKAFLSI